MNEIVKSLIFDVVVKAAIKRLFTLVPILGIPVVSQIVSWGITKLAGIIYDEMSKVITFGVIDMQVESQKKAYDEAVVKLKEVNTEDKEAVERAKEEFRNKMRDLIRLN